MPDQKAWNIIILAFSTAIFIGLELYSITTDSHYKWDFIFIMLLMIAVFLYQKQLNLIAVHYAMFSLMLILHNLGTFRTYTMFPLGMEYDYWVHIYAGLILAFIFVRAMESHVTWPKAAIYVQVLIIILAIAAFHELFEYGGALVVGKGEGVLFVGAGDIDEWDTQKDMFNNLLGGCIGILLLEGWRRIRKKNT